MSMSIRGEVPLTVCGKAVSIAPTYRAIESIEQRLGVGIPALMARLVSGDLRVRDLAVVVHEGLKGAGHGGRDGAGEAFSLEQVGDDVMSDLRTYGVAVSVFLTNALGGAPEKKAQRGGSAPESRSRGGTTSRPPPGG